jgi:hypothetical protein
MAGGFRMVRIDASGKAVASDPLLPSERTIDEYV